MPRETFFNLPEEKRQLICQVAIAEFAEHPYERASVNRIVTQAGIAKGSFYQYFSGKKDLYLYILELATREKLAYFSATLGDLEGEDFFNLLRKLYIAGIRFAKAFPQYTRIGKNILASKGKPIFNEVMEHNAPYANRFMKQLLEQAIQRGEVRKDFDLDLFTYLFSQMSTLVLEYYTEYISEDYDEQMMSTVNQFIEFLRHGIGTHPERHTSALEEESLGSRNKL